MASGSDSSSSSSSDSDSSSSDSSDDEEEVSKGDLAVLYPPWPRVEVDNSSWTQYSLRLPRPRLHRVRLPLPLL